MNYKIISADVHITEPPDIWKNHLPEKYQEHAPKLVKDHEGGDAWLYAGSANPDPIGLTTTPGKRRTPTTRHLRRTLSIDPTPIGQAAREGRIDDQSRPDCLASPRCGLRCAY